MLEFDDYVTDLTKNGWEVVLLSINPEVGDYTPHGYQVKARKSALGTEHIVQLDNYERIMEAIQLLSQVVDKKQVSNSTFTELESSAAPSSTRAPHIAEGMGEVELLNEMAYAGWSSKVVYPPQHRTSKSQSKTLVFAKHVWHGRELDKPVIVDRRSILNADWDRITFNLATTCLQAYVDFPNAIPYVDSLGQLVIDEKLTAQIFG
jgi:hypothetical protein